MTSPSETEPQQLDDNLLDPANWEEFRSFLHELSDDVTTHLKDIRQKRVWTRPTPDVYDAFRSDIPVEGKGVDATYEEFKTNILPHIAGNIHPRFWGWVVGSGAPSSMVGDWLAAFVNGVPTIFDESARLTEIQIIDWIKSLFGFDDEASGVLTTGVSESTLIALVAARHSVLGEVGKQKGLYGIDADPVFYLCDQTHDSSRKAIEIMGFGSDHIQTIASDDQFQMKPDLLADQIKNDLQQGRKPIAVIATVGTVGTGAFDDLEAIGAICKKENIWLHVDGAFGVWAILSETKKDNVRGLEYADSLVFDMHKWMYQSYDIGCVLVRSAVKHRRSLQVSANYLDQIEGTLRNVSKDLCDYTIQLSRGFKALKFWFSLKSEGLSSFAKAIDHNIDCADYLTRRIEQSPNLELLAPTSLNVVNFRYLAVGKTNEELNKINTELVRRLNSDGVAVPSSLIFDGKFAIRIAISNHRTNRNDIDLMLDHVLENGALVSGA
ncbi:MAG: cytochrome d ubiquinol oxidase subunit I [Hyphococcus sp.]|nr:MAG: cytochrome d ubiquinol oxidase subunit I [Marinicaulis sp.]